MQAKYQLKTAIGDGSYGIVYEATLNNEPVAAKVLHPTLIYPTIVDKFREECELLQRLNHKNVVKLIQFNISNSSPPVLFTELLACDLKEYITNLTEPKKIPFPEVVSIILDVANGLVYLHYVCAIIHRDLASKNILLTKTGQAKIADLGLAKFFGEKQGMSASPVPGTPLYAAPETHPNPGASSPMVVYNEKIDIFSLGIISMVVINGREPKCVPVVFDTDGRRIPENERRKDDIREMGDHRLRGLVLSCIEDNSDRRLNAKEVVEWLQKEKSIIEKKITIVHRRTPNCPPTLKILPLGNSATGKTSIIKRFKDNCFTDSPDRPPPTVGHGGVFIQNITLNGKRFSLSIHDTAGQERFDSLTSSFLRDADGVLLVFDVTNSESFEQGIARTKRLIDHYLDDCACTILVGNKVDAGGERKVTRKQAEQLAANLGVRYFETSAKTGQNIETVFEELAKEIYNELDLSDIGTYPPKKPCNGAVLLGQELGQEQTEKFSLKLSRRCPSC